MFGIEMCPRLHVGVGPRDALEQGANVVLAAKPACLDLANRLDERQAMQGLAHGSIRTRVADFSAPASRDRSGRNRACRSLRKRRPSAVGLMRWWSRSINP